MKNENFRKRRTFNNSDINEHPNFSFNLKHSNYYRHRRKRRIPNYSYNFNLISSNNSYIIPSNYKNLEYKDDISFVNSYRNNSINPVNNILREIKDTIKNTRQILNKNDYYIKTENSKISNLNKSIKHKRNKSKSQKKKKNYISLKTNTDNDNIDENPKESKKESEILDKLYLLRSKLMKFNIDIRKENQLLEFEMNLYKTQINSRKFNYIMKNNLPFINNNYTKYKSMLKSSINKNTTNLDKILRLEESNIYLNNQIKSNSLLHEQLFKQVENINRENAEIQLINEENENKFNYLKKEGENLLDKMEKLNIDLDNLKNKEKNFRIIKDSNYKKIKDSEIIIKKLHTNKNILEEELNKKTEKMKSNTNIIHNNKRKLIFFNDKLNNLKNDLSNLESEKIKQIDENSQIKNELKSLDNEFNYQKKNDDISVTRIKNEYNRIKNINMNIKSQIKQKEKEIENLKISIDQINTTNDMKFKNKILGTKIKSIIEENQNTKKASKNEIDLYKNIIEQKNNIINDLEKQLKMKNQNYHSFNHKKSNNKNKLNYKNKRHISSGFKNDKINYEKMIYNKFNNRNSQENMNKEDKNQNILDIDNLEKDNEQNNEYFEVKEKTNLMNPDKFVVNEGKISDLDDLVNQNSFDTNNKYLNYNNKQNIQKKDTDDLGEIANQIEEYNLSNRYMNENQKNNIDEELININPKNINFQKDENNNEEYYENNSEKINNEEKKEELKDKGGFEEVNFEENPLKYVYLNNEIIYKNDDFSQNEQEKEINELIDDDYKIGEEEEYNFENNTENEQNMDVIEEDEYYHNSNDENANDGQYNNNIDEL